MYDVLIIGAGVCGTLTARELTKRGCKVLFVDKGPDAASGASRANSGIVHAGFDAQNGTLKARLNVKGCAMMPQVAKELDVEYKNTPSLVVCLSEEDRPTLEALYERGVKNGVPNLRIIEREELKKAEPNISDDAVAALYAPSAGIISPYELAIAAGENAVQNGAHYRFGFEVKTIEPCDGGYTVSDGKESVSARFIVNAAGLYSDVIASLCGDCDFTLIPRKGEYMLFDKNVAGCVRNVLFPLPTKAGKGVLVAPTADGNMLIGPNANVTDKDDTTTSAKGLSEIHEQAKKLMPNLPPLSTVITSFAGLRPTPSTGDFIIKPSKKYPHILHLCGIESPGIASSPAIAEYAAEMLSEMGLSYTENASFDPCRKKVLRMREMTNEQHKAAIEADPSYGKIICRCETVTEGEILDAIRRPMGATTVDGVKRRTRAGMGRCQGGFCMPRVTELLARERKCDFTEIRKFDEESVILVGKTK